MGSQTTNTKSGNSPGGGPYAQERYISQFPHCGRVSLKFDGKHLSLTTDKGVLQYPAVSGKPSSNGKFDYRVERQKIRDVGPIPVGKYWIRLDELWENAWYKFNSPTAAWGDFRISIHPFPTTQTHGRGGFFIHGGKIPGSAGCIDLTKHMNKFIKDLKARSGGTKKCQVHLTVQY